MNHIEFTLHRFSELSGPAPDKAIEDCINCNPGMDKAAAIKYLSTADGMLFHEDGELDYDYSTQFYSTYNEEL